MALATLGQAKMEQGAGVVGHGTQGSHELLPGAFVVAADVILVNALGVVRLGRVGSQAGRQVGGGAHPLDLRRGAIIAK